MKLSGLPTGAGGGTAGTPMAAAKLVDVMGEVL